MVCPKCGVEGFISSKELFFEGDNSNNTATKAFYKFNVICRNENCENYLKVIDEMNIELN